ncbi:MAG: choice-of-anchor Q domain-containing protein [Synechococcales bacterium]|nr:choice-of-anchor Q domain-containing protein [Synechococcales bacterium]
MSNSTFSTGSFLIGSPIKLSGNLTSAFTIFPELAYNDVDQEYVAVWAFSGSGGSDLALQRFTSAGNLIGSNIQIPEIGTSLSDADITYNQLENQYLVSFTNNVFDPNRGLFGQLLSADGTSVGSNFLISDIIFEPSFVYNPNQTEYFQTSRRFPGSNAIFGQRISKDGLLVDSAIRIDEFGDSAPNGEVAFNPINNQYLATWRKQSGSIDIVGRLISEDGSFASNQFNITTDTELAFSINAVFDPTNTQFLIAYGLPDIGDIKAQFVDADGSRIGNEITILDDGYSLRGEEVISVVFSPEFGMYLLAASTDSGLLGQFISNSGSLIDAPFVISPRTDISHISVVYNSFASQFAVSWSFSRSNEGVFAQLISPPDIQLPLTLTVNTLVDEADGSVTDGDVSLRDAIAAIAPGGTITFADDLVSGSNNGTITLALGELLIDKSLKINGDLNNDANPDITIDANQQSRVFNIDNGTGASVDISLEGLTITGGRTLNYGENGGGIYTLESLTLTNSRILDNSTFGYGGGIYSIGDLTISGSGISGSHADNEGGGIFSIGTVKVNDSRIDNNYSGFYGGGIYNVGTVTVTSSTVSGNATFYGAGGIEGDIVTVINSTISDNYAGYRRGGGINGDVVTVIGSTITQNYSYRNGGGISGGTVTVTNSTVSNNHSENRGGGGISGGTVTVSNSTISGNRSDGVDYGGGGIDSGTATVVNSTISGNFAKGDGGGINSFNLTVTNGTITLNESQSNAGGVFTNGSDVVIKNSIIAGNTAVANPDVEGSFVSNGANLVGDPTGSTGFETDQTFASAGITNISEVLDPTLRDNGGFTQTHALVPDSPALDGGRNADAVDENGNPLEFDQRGSGFDRVVNGTVDIGAVEEQDSPPAGNAFFFSPEQNTPGLGNAEDIVQFDSTGFSVLFDGSALGLSSAHIDAFDIISATEILLSFDQPLALNGLGQVDDSDVVKFTARSLGEGTTTGTFEMVLDGSTLELTQAGEDIDALTRMTDGSLLFSTQGSASLFDGHGQLRVQDEDLVRYDPVTGGVSLYLDGSDIGLTKDSEDINGVSMRDGELLLSTIGRFNVSGIDGRDEDVFSFTPTSTGSRTTGTFASTLFFDGSEFGFTGDIAAIDFSVG